MTSRGRRLSSIGGLVLLLLAGWSAFWFVARSRVLAELDALADTTPSKPVRLVCADRAIGGFPFDLSVACRDPALTIVGDAGPVDIRFAQLVARASLFSPQRISSDLAGPLTAQDASGRTQAGWTAMHIDVDGAALAIRSLSLSGSGLNLACEACFEPLRASRVESFDLHFERRGDTRDYAFSVGANGLQNALLLQLTASDLPAAFAANGAISQFEVPDSLRFAAEAERWRLAGGQLSVDMASLDQGAMRAQISGAFALDASHRPSGSFQIGARNAATLVSAFTGSLSPLLKLAIGAALRGIDSATAKSGNDLDVNFPGRIENGSLSIGPLQNIARVAPLY